MGHRGCYCGVCAAPKLRSSAIRSDNRGKGEGNMRNKSWLLLAGLVLLGVAHPAGRMLGQAVYGSIIGTVTDSSGAAVPNAKVTITNVDKGVIVTTATNESGNYEQQHLIVGTYDVKVEAPGFQTSVQ